MIVAIINLKGGVGKTTTAIALATAASRSGMESVVLDADQQSSASLWALAAAEGDDPLPFEVESANIATIRKVRSKKDRFVVIDCPPNGRVTDEAMAKADFVVVPTTPSAMDMQQTWVTTATLEEAGKLHAILLTRCQPRTLAFKGTLAEIKEKDASAFETHIPQREDVKNFFGSSFGDDLFGYDSVLREIEEAMA